LVIPWFLDFFFLPFLQILDDKELPKEIRFEDDEEGRPVDMPASVAKLVKSPEAGALVLQFLEQYFLIYDSASRQGLLDAYHEHAVMSLSATG
jgi:nuclear RNA export factor